jgi:mRNA interferase HicA
LKGRELIRLLKRHAAAHGLPFAYDGSFGKGGHGRITLGHRFATIPAPHRELKTGTAHAIIKQLGLRKADLGL